MRYFGNPEVRRLSLTLGTVFALLCAAGFLIDAPFGFFALSVCVLLYAVSLFLMIRWLREIEKLTGYVTSALSGGAVLDISDNREGEVSIFKNELYKLASELRRQADREAASRRELSNSLADISHQLKTPLTAVGIIAELLGQPETEERERAKLTRDLKSLTQRMDALTQALLKLSKLDAGAVSFAREPVPVREILDRALEPLEIPMELRGITVQTKGGAEARIFCDRMWTAEAVGNLIKNCMEHTPEGGFLYFEYEENTLFSRITVSDSGKGFAPDDLPHLFERFYRGKNTAGEGFGIGLALARQIVSAQGGTLQASNAPLGGARFILEFFKKTL